MRTIRRHGCVNDRVRTPRRDVWCARTTLENFFTMIGAMIGASHLRSEFCIQPS
jgi:hypothetical protein